MLMKTSQTPLAQPSWLSDIGYFDAEVSERFIRALAIGRSGSGKTTFGATAPNPVVIDIDKGGLVLRKKHIPFIPCYESEHIANRVLSILAAAEKRVGPFAPEGEFGQAKTIVFDGISAFSTSALSGLVKSNGKDPLTSKPGYDEYGALLNIMQAVGRALRRVSMSYHVIVTALVDLAKDEITGSTIAAPMVQGSYRNLIEADFDEVYFLSSSEEKDKPPKYFIDTVRRGIYPGKSRLGAPARIENPHFDVFLKALNS